MSIKDLWIKIKLFRGWFVSTPFLKFKPSNEVIMAIIIVLVGTASFGLGRLSALETKKEPVTIKYPYDTNTSDLEAVAGQIIASKTGTKYHFPWCSGAKAISEKNRIIFASKEEAEKAGYAPAGNCKGL